MGVGVKVLEFGYSIKNGLSKLSCKVGFPVGEGLPIIPENSGRNS